MTASIMDSDSTQDEAEECTSAIIDLQHVMRINLAPGLGMRLGLVDFFTLIATAPLVSVAAGIQWRTRPVLALPAVLANRSPILFSK